MKKHTNIQICKYKSLAAVFIHAVEEKFWYTKEKKRVIFMSCDDVKDYISKLHSNLKNSYTVCYDNEYFGFLDAS